MSAQRRKSENMVEMSPQSIRFSQLSVDSKFRNGKLLKDTLEEILENPELTIGAIPPIKVYRSSEGYHAATTGNRRLYLFKLLFEYGLIKSVQVIVTKKQKSKSTHESQETDCAQETILRVTIERHLAAGSEVPKKSDENKADSSAVPYSQTPSQNISRRALRTLNALPNSVDRVTKIKRRKTEVGKETTPDCGLRHNLRKRKSPDSSPPTIRGLTDEDQSQGGTKAPVEMNAIETFRSPNKSFEDENEDSPKRPRLTPSPDQSFETQLKSVTTGNSQEMEEFTID